MESDVSEGGSERGLHDYREGEEIDVRGNTYEIVGVDPTEEGVRAYHLDGDTGMTARLDVHERQECFYLILAGKVDPSEVSLHTDSD